MRNVWIVVASALLAFANFVKSQETARNLYSSRYDNLDIDTILSSNRLVSNYVDCLLSRKPCPPEGKDLKRILPEALRTKCGRCSVTQKENALKIITTLYYSYPDQYQALRGRWDPTGEYHRRFEEYLRGLQFNQIGSNSGANSINDRPVRNDFDRDQSQILLQTLILSTTAATPLSQNALPSGPEQRPQLVPTAQLTQPLPTVGVLSNRFGDEGNEGNNVAVQPSNQGVVVPNAVNPRPTVRPTVRPTTRPVVRQTTSRVVTQRTTLRFGVASTNSNDGPIVGLFNQLGTKLATTADAIAGMLRKTVDVIVTSHLQSHQRALRSY